MTKHVHRGSFMPLALPLFVVLFTFLCGNTWASMGAVSSHCCDGVLDTATISAWDDSSTGEHVYESQMPLDYDGCSNSKDCANSTCGMCSSGGLLPCIGWLNDVGRKVHIESRDSLNYHLTFLSPPNPSLQQV